MFDEVWAFALTIPAHTPSTAPVVLPCHFPARKVEQIYWRVPAGHVGLTGFRVSMGGVQVFPANIGGWIIANGEQETWPVKDTPDSGAWDMTAYNTGNVQHSVFLRFMVQLFHKDEPPLTPLPNWKLAAVPDLSQAGPPIGQRP